MKNTVELDGIRGSFHPNNLIMRPPKLLRWLQQLPVAPKRCFVTYGEPESASASPWKRNWAGRPVYRRWGTPFPFDPVCQPWGTSPSCSGKASRTTGCLICYHGRAMETAEARTMQNIRSRFRAGKYLSIALCLSLMLLAGRASAVIDRQQATAIVTAFENTELKDFRTFLDLLGRHRLGKELELKTNITLYLTGGVRAPEADHDIYRLLGIYSRLKYGKAAIETLRRLVAIPTFRVDGVPQHENPQFLKFADTLATIAAEFNLAFRNVDNRVYEISLDGTGDKLVGLHAHADVVPVNPELWVLEDGTRLDPFQLRIIDGRMYGRGTEDDKNGIVVTLYAMKVVKEEKIPLVNDFKLLVDTTEETTSDAIPYYFERNPTPGYNLAMDGGYPVVTAEKGYGTVMATFPVRPGQGEGAEIVSITGGLATNQIPSTSVARFVTDNPESLAASLNTAGEAYVAANGSNFSINAAAAADGVVLTVKGVSAHSSTPDSGVNPVSRMLDFIHGLASNMALKSNHITDAARYASENWGLDFQGQKLGIGFADDFMGPLTAALTYVNLNDERLQLAVNLRVPVGKPIPELKTELAEKLNGWVKDSGVAVSIEHTQREPMYRDPSGTWVNELLDIATQNLGLERKFASSNGATSVHDLPNGVQFGLAMPDEKYTGHNANEFKRIEQFELDLQIVTEMIARIGQVEDL